MVTPAGEWGVGGLGLGVEVEGGGGGGGGEVRNAWWQPLGKEGGNGGLWAAV